MSWKVPFDSKGNHQTWGGYLKEENFKDNYEFMATLEYAGFSRGRSALNIKWKDVDRGITYESGMKLLDDVLANTLPFHYANIDEYPLRVQGNFTFKKQGTSVLLTHLK